MGRPESEARVALAILILPLCFLVGVLLGAVFWALG